MPSLATEREWDYRVWADEVWKTCRGLDVEHAQDAYEYAIVKLNGGDSLRRELARRDLFYLLYYLLHREDMGHPWLYARVREVEVARDWHLDLWAREHRKLLRVGRCERSDQGRCDSPGTSCGECSHGIPLLVADAASLLGTAARPILS